jgi:6-methylsalicylate decarboxylase
MRLDVHAHYFSKEYVALLESFGFGADRLEPGYRLLHQTREADFAERFAAMDRAQVDKQILSVSGVSPYTLEEKHAVEGSRFANDLYTALAREMPARFAAFAILSILGTSLADPSFDPIYAELDKRGAVLFIHPAGLACGSAELVSTGLTWPLGAPFEDSMSILELLQGGFTQRFPRVRVIVPHLGGTLPFLIQRLDHMAGRFMAGKGVPREELSKFWYDTVNGYPPSLRLAIETFGLKKVVFGTDWPFWKGEAHQLAADYITQTGLSKDDTDAIFVDNARALFGDRIQ